MGLNAIRRIVRADCLSRPIRRIMWALIAVAVWSCSTSCCVAQVGDPTDAVAREVSVFVPIPPMEPATDAVAREVSVFVPPAPMPPPTDAVTREVSVFVPLPPMLPPTDAVTRELSTFCLGIDQPTVGVTNRAAADYITTTGGANFRFTLWGVVTVIDDDSFTLDDGSGSPITVLASGSSGLANGDYAKATGVLLNKTGDPPTLISCAAAIEKIEE